MKLTPNEKTMCYKKALMLFIVGGHITWKESVYYDYLRSSAFYSATAKKRNLSRINAKHFQAEFGFTRNKTHQVLKKLEKMGLIQPYYYVADGDGLRETTDFSTLFPGNINHTKYKVKNVPGEKEIKLKLIKKKKAKAVKK